MSANPDLEPLYAALKKADAAGDAEGAKKLAGYIREKSTAPPKGPPPPKVTDKPEEPSLWDKAKVVGGSLMDLYQAPARSALGLAGDAAAAPVAGLAGVAQGASNLVTGSNETSAADRVQQVQGAVHDVVAPQPNSPAASITKAVSYPFEKLGEAGDWAGQKTSEVTGSPALGAAVNTAIQAAPSAILPELAGKGPLGARIAARRQPAPRVEPTISSEPAPAGAPPVSGTPPARPPGTGPDQVPFSADPNAPAAPKQPLNTPARQTAAQRAEAYVRDRVGVDWSGLSQGLKDTITQIAADAGSLDKLDPKAVARKARADAAELPVTRGQATRNLSQITKEENLVKSDAGAKIRDVKSEQDQRLGALVDEVRKSTGATATTREQVGKSVQDSGLRAQIRKSKSNYDTLYKKARNTEPDATVPPDSLYDFVRGNPEVLNPQIQHLSWLQGWLKKAGIEKEMPATAEGALADTGNAPLGEKRGVKLAELDDLRKKALSIAKGGGDSAHYAGEVIKAIDESFEKVPEAAKAWKEAREAFKSHKLKYEETGINERLGIDKSKAGDRHVALEDTVDKITRSSSEDIGKLKETLGADSQEWKDVQGGVVDKLKEAATGKRIIANEEGVPQFNSAFRDLFNELDKDGKVDQIFSPEQARRLRDINQLVQDVRTTPSGRVAGSDTVPRLVSMLDAVEHLPGAPVVKPITQAIKKYVEGQHALGDPLQDAAKGAKRAVRNRVNKKAAATAAPAFTIGEQLQRDQPQ